MTTARFKHASVPTVIIAERAMEDMLHITRIANTEIGWLGFAERVDAFTYRVTEVFLPHQEVSGTTTEMQPEHLSAAALEIIERFGPEKYDQLRVWGHSHVNMGVGPSKQDDDTLDWMADSVSDFFIAIRVNKSGSIQVDVGYPHLWSYVDVKHRLEGVRSEREDQWRSAIAERVTLLADKPTKQAATHTPSIIHPTNEGWRNGGRPNDYAPHHPSHHKWMHDIDEDKGAVVDLSKAGAA